MKKATIELRLLLPDVTHSDDACIERLSQLLKWKAGVDDAHVTPAADGDAAKICIHYNSSVVSTGEVRELAKRAGMELDRRYGHWLSNARSMHARRASAIESRLGRIDGVIEAVVSPDGAVRVEFEREQQARPSSPKR